MVNHHVIQFPVWIQMGLVPFLEVSGYISPGQDKPVFSDSSPMILWFPRKTAPYISNTQLCGLFTHSLSLKFAVDHSPLWLKDQPTQIISLSDILAPHL